MLRPMKPAAFPEEVFQLRIQVRGIEPPIFRVIQVTNTRTFHLLHEIVQYAFGWENKHLYEFRVGPTKISEPSPDFLEPTRPRHPRTTRLGDLLSDNVTRFTYSYEFGDEWVHDIVIEGRSAPDPAVRCPICPSGARAGPPEDAGGPEGYEEFLEVWRDPKHERHEEMRSWAGPRYDPERLDLKLVNEVLKTFRAAAPRRAR